MVNTNRNCIDLTDFSKKREVLIYMLIKSGVKGLLFFNKMLDH